MNSKLIVPEGYTTREDKKCECYGCEFCLITGCDEDEEISCTHPNSDNPGCADHNVIFVKP